MFFSWPTAINLLIMDPIHPTVKSHSGSIFNLRKQRVWCGCSWQDQAWPLSTQKPAAPATPFLASSASSLWKPRCGQDPDLLFQSRAEGPKAEAESCSAMSRGPTKELWTEARKRTPSIPDLVRRKPHPVLLRRNTLYPNRSGPQSLLTRASSVDFNTCIRLFFWYCSFRCFLVWSGFFFFFLYIFFLWFNYSRKYRETSHSGSQRTLTQHSRHNS